MNTMPRLFLLLCAGYALLWGLAVFYIIFFDGGNFPNLLFTLLMQALFFYPPLAIGHLFHSQTGTRWGRSGFWVSLLTYIGIIIWQYTDYQAGGGRGYDGLKYPVVGILLASILSMAITGLSSVDTKHKRYVQRLGYLSLFVLCLFLFFLGMNIAARNIGGFSGWKIRESTQVLLLAGAVTCSLATLLAATFGDWFARAFLKQSKNPE